MPVRSHFHDLTWQFTRWWLDISCEGEFLFTSLRTSQGLHKNLSNCPDVGRFVAPITCIQYVRSLGLSSVEPSNETNSCYPSTCGPLAAGGDEVWIFVGVIFLGFPFYYPAPNENNITGEKSTSVLTATDGEIVFC